MTATLLTVALIFAQLSLLAFGGGQTIVPEMHRQVVDVQGWMSSAEFVALFALAQAAPGPNMLVSTLLGWRIAGLPGALVATLALTTPSGLLTFFTTRAWYRFRDRPWRLVVQRGLVPVTVGLVTAAALLLAETTSATWAHAFLTVATATVLLTTRINPLLLLAVGAALGAAGIFG